MSEPYRGPSPGQSGNPVYVRVVDFRLSWRNVFVLIFKFTIAFLVIDAVVIVAWVIAIMALLDS